MSHVLSVARKELRAYFLSPIALIFLGTFLFVTLFTFFWVEQFFARNIADVRPLFAWFPLLLLFLCSALTMRLWSEEQRAGTLEILLTLPVKAYQLVLGKFLASLGLVGVALVLTFGVPITVSFLGDIDWGPVIGGYVASILLAGAYLAIGLWISSQTENQIVSLILSVVVCSLLYLLGSDVLTQAVGNEGAEILAALGTGSRFDSITRGVLDLRDLVYYLSLIVVFLSLNVLSLRAKGFSSGSRTVGKRQNAILVPVLAAANVFAFNVMLSGLGFARVDLTERGEYSISNVTKRLLRQLDEPLLIRGYFSEKTHPLLAPMVPRIRDMIEEYGELGGARVETDYVDPREDEELEKEARQLYGIESFPFRVASRLDQAVVNSYFSILVKYGDEFEVLNFDDLIEISGTNPSNIEVKLRNLEYDMTRTIKKVAFGFESTEAIFSKLEEPAELMAFVTPDSLPENFADAVETIEAVAQELQEQAGDEFEYRIVNPDEPGAYESRESLAQKYGLRPYQVSLLDETTFYLHMLLRVGDRMERVVPSPEGITKADLKESILESLKRAAPGFLTTVGLSKPEVQPPNPQLPPQLQQQQQRDLTRALSQALSENTEVEEVDLTEGRVPSNVDVLLVYAPKDFGAKQRFAIDQFLMRGGTVLLFSNPFHMKAGFGGNLQVEKVSSGLSELLDAYGITVRDELVMDLQNEGIPVPVQRDLGGFTVREVRNVSYPFFVDVRPGSLGDSVVTAGLPALTLPFASPVIVEEKSGEDEDEASPREVVTLIESSPDSWTTTRTDVQPDFETHPDNGFAVGEERKRRPLAALVTGSFTSAFDGKEAPIDSEVLVQSPDTTRLAVVGSTAVLNDLAFQLSRQASTGLQLVQNLVDWGVADTELLSIRSGGTFARTLKPLEPSERAVYEYVNYGIVIVALGLLVAVTYGRRRRMKPIALDGTKTAPPAGAVPSAEAQS